MSWSLFSGFRKMSPWWQILTNHRSFQRERAFLLAVLRSLWPYLMCLLFTDFTMAAASQPLSLMSAANRVFQTTQNILKTHRKQNMQSSQSQNIHSYCTVQRCFSESATSLPSVLIETWLPAEALTEGSRRRLNSSAKCYARSAMQWGKTVMDIY